MKVSQLAVRLHNNPRSPLADKIFHPCIFFRDKNLHIANPLEGVEGAYFGCSSEGWIKTELFYCWIKKHFSTRVEYERPVLKVSQLAVRLHNNPRSPLADKIFHPCIFFRDKNLHIANPLEGVEGAYFGCSSEGWIKTELFYCWIKKHFSTRVEYERPVLLLLDGHTINLDIIRRMKFYFIVSHPTHCILLNHQMWIFLTPKSTPENGSGPCQKVPLPEMDQVPRVMVNLM